MDEKDLKKLIDDEESLELQNIRKSIQAYIDKHEGEAAIFASFIAFDKNSEVVDDRIYMFGYKDSLKIDAEEYFKEMLTTEEEFVNNFYIWPDGDEEHVENGE